MLESQQPTNSSLEVEKADSSFKFNSETLPKFPADPTLDYILNVGKYMPVGCLRIRQSDCAISLKDWKSCSSWQAFAHPRDVYGSQWSFSHLDNELQEDLLSSPILRPYDAMHNAGWIRMEFKIKDQHLGQIRVYILPDDVGRGTIDRRYRSLRNAMQLLIAQIDISNATWNGKWDEDTPVAHVDSSLDEKPKEDVSLFYLFNTLPSPKPDPETVVDKYARNAMYRILDSDIEGLTTRMHSYQRRSAALMLQREAQPSQIIDPRLRPIIDQNGATWFCDLDAGTCLREPRTYESARGGICAETMGLGKTLICLALILATRDLAPHVPVEYSIGTLPVRPKTGSLKDMAAATIGRTGTPWKTHFAAKEAEGDCYSLCLDAIRRNAGHYFLPGPAPRRESRNLVAVPPRKIWLTAATIVVVPQNLVQQWRHEIKKHTVGLKVLVMNSNKAHLPPAEELAEFDLILFSKQRFDKEAKDGADDQGRRRTNTNNFCQCPYIASTRDRNCTCFKEEDAYRSPLKDLHFKRLITDEGHTFGNASNSSRTEAVTVIEFLQLSSRWIVSGTPTQGLYGAEVTLSHSESSSTSNTPLDFEDNESPRYTTGGITNKLLDLPDSSETALETSSEQGKLFYKQERKDLEKLGNIATTYLKARPWAKTEDDYDTASWSQHVLQPRHGSKSHGNMDCLRSTLEGMIIRHRPEDVSIDITLPPLHQTVVYLDGCMQDRLSLNMFAMMIVSNAVTSERKDNDYFFHPSQRKSLQLLVSNMRQASFFWSNFNTNHVESTINVAKTFLEKREVPVTPEDESLLRDAIEVGELFIANKISKAGRTLHEMPMYFENQYPEEVRAAWSLNGDTKSPTLMGATMVHAMYKFVSKQLWKEDVMDGMVEEGRKASTAADLAQHPRPKNRPSKNRPSKMRDRDLKVVNKAIGQATPTLAGGVSLGDEATPLKRFRTYMPLTAQPETTFPSCFTDGESAGEMSQTVDSQEQLNERSSITIQNFVRRKNITAEIVGALKTTSLASTAIVSTPSAKLSYLMDQIVTYQSTEKIIVFYEADNVAYYIAQALEILGIEHLIYAKSLASSRRSNYVVTFNQTETFRVLLMDVSQAAFGLDMSSASRVYFVNPVFSPQIEAQAVKRAHRIGQTRPVFVETLVLRGSIEEVIVERRKNMSTEEHNKCKSILDDQTMYDWVRNVRFLPLPLQEIPGPDQMAKLETPQLLFGSGVPRIGEHDPDADLVLDHLNPKDKGKNTVKKSSFAAEESSLSQEVARKRKVAFAIPEKEGYIKPTSTDDGDEERKREQELFIQETKKVKLKRVSLTATEHSPGNAILRSVAVEDQTDDPFEIIETDREPSNEDTAESLIQWQPHNEASNCLPNGPLAPLIPTGPVHLSSPPSQSLPRWENGPWVSAKTTSAAIQSSEFTSGNSNAIKTQSFIASQSDKFAYTNAVPSVPSRLPLSFNLPTKSIIDEDEIEYSTPRPRTKHRQVLGVKMPNGEFKTPPRNFSTSTSTDSGSGYSSPSSSSNTHLGSGLANGQTLLSSSRIQKSKLEAKSLLLKLKVGPAVSKLPGIEEKSNAWRAEMGANGGKLGKRGWERTFDTRKSPEGNKPNRKRKNGADDDNAETFVS